MRSPSVVIKDSKGNIIGSANYTLSKPSGRKNVGKYTVTVTLKGNYSGKNSVTYKINPKGCFFFSSAYTSSNSGCCSKYSISSCINSSGLFTVSFLLCGFLWIFWGNIGVCGELSSSLFGVFIYVRKSCCWITVWNDFYHLTNRFLLLDKFPLLKVRKMPIFRMKFYLGRRFLCIDKKKTDPRKERFV